MIDQLFQFFFMHFRPRRMRRFSRLFAIDERTRIIDVGGYEFNWQLLDVKPTVLLLNLEDDEWERGQFRKIKGDGRCLQFADDSFDVAYSNSVIEHVGDFNDQLAFANEIRRIAPRYFVQTPNKWFFIEPHLLTVFIHFFPRQVTRRLVRHLSLRGWIEKPDQAAVDALLGSIRLLDKNDMKLLFPDAELLEERFLGMIKSIIAVRRAGDESSSISSNKSQAVFRHVLSALFG